jgi:predicted N-acetyltransferase YhbS
VKANRVRQARVDVAPTLTQIAVRATKNDESSISRFMPVLKIDLALIAAGLVFVAEDDQSLPHGYVAVRPMGWPGLILLDSIFVDPDHSRSGIGTQLFAAAIEHSRKMAGSVLLVYSSPHSVDFYARLGAIRIGTAPFVFSLDVQLTIFAFTIAQSVETGSSPA